MRRMLAIVPLVGALLCPAAFGQKPVDINAMSAYCFEHAGEISNRCVAGLPLIPRSSPTMEIEPLSPPTGPNVDQIAGAYKAKLHKQDKDFRSGIAPSSTSVAFPKPQPTTNSQPDLSGAPACGANCQQSGYQQSYEAGEAMGSAISSIVGGLWARHKINSYCKKHPEGGWKFSDGSTMSCASWNAKKPVRVWPASAANQAQIRRISEQSHSLMEELRQDLQQEAGAPPGSYPDTEQLRQSWLDMRNIYCEHNPGAPYTDLAGQVENCAR